MTITGKAVTGKIAWIRKDKDFALIVNRDRCKGCGLCIDVCPKKVLILGDLNSRGYKTSTAINPDDCIKCRRCEKICPDFAIYLVETVANKNWAKNALIGEFNE